MRRRMLILLNCTAIYRPMIPYAAARNVRLILVNVRDYPGSTPYSPSELAALNSSNLKEQWAMLNERGQEAAAFLLWFIQKERIPQIAGSQGDSGVGAKYYDHR